ncbi:S8 family peptidase [Cylindrospermum sp. FACHB-282]|uniref:S8 family peptidase n=1 Tax=Cylindrospermum sp. FACHB-282 TaxID=2692794 RepID=UPI0016872B00|nr:S8 family peptidase [Cylindrospermum sp. FACHB-282]MBD2384643.1 S8 family serine peptidase [Cylindrospermum sp. FACHB-282]
MPIDEISSSLSNNGLNVTPISSVDTFNIQGDNSLSLSGRSSFNSANDTANISSTGNYNSSSGYGLVNAADAVSRAAGEDTYDDVANIGGNNSGADMVKAPEAWEHGYTGKGVIVAVIDTGVDYNHEDLQNNIWTNSKEIAGNGIDDDGNGYVDDVQGWNFVSNNNNTLDDNSHGTHVAGTIAGENNDIGVTGVAYDAKIMPVKVLNESGSGSYSAIAKGIRYAADNGANVINLSLGGSYSNNTLKTAIEYASSKGVIVVMAAGNDGASSPGYPARYAYNTGIAVGAVDEDNNLADFSNRSGSQEITYVTAPGVDVYSSLPNNQYGTYSGTSMATPHVAGVVALMLSANPNLTQTQVRQIITGQAEGSSETLTSSQTSDSINKSAKSTEPIPVPSVVVTIGENGWPVKFGDYELPTMELSVSSISSENQIANSSINSSVVSSANQSPFRYYDNSLSNNSIGSDHNYDAEGIVKKRQKN